jgi:ribose/xylose/arabinose/galactoside ABC-type transport system permease subunit
MTDIKSKKIRLGMFSKRFVRMSYARASGINTIRYKLLAFCLGFFAGIAEASVHVMKIAGLHPGIMTSGNL